MHNMTTVQLNTRFLTDRCCVTNCTEIIDGNIWSRRRIHLFNALWFKTWHALGLACDAPARMTARKELIARFLHKSKTVWLSADVSEGWLHTWWRLLQFVTAESTSPCSLLFARSSNMIRLCIAFGAEILTASIASNPIHGHVLSRLHWDGLTLIIFLAHLHLTWNHFHHITALATN